ncbi:MAG TPA: family 16 glycosylhydrolase [Polyangiaceae bacterium]|nr:family 16 glycosylhydrolase [Polyangiaceae bacterium]
MLRVHTSPLVRLVAVVTATSATGCSGSPASQPKGPDTSPTQLAPVSEAELPPRVSRAGVEYELAWLDDFARGLGPSTLGNWTFGSNLAWFHPSNVRTSEGGLDLWLTARGDTAIDSDRTILGAEYDRNGPQKFGRFLARMRPVARPGMVASFFTAFYQFDASYSKLLETSEIDIEFVGSTKAAQFALHWVDATGTKQHIERLVDLDFDASADFHTWEIEWLAERVVFYVDGRELHRFDDAAIVRELEHPQEVRANLWVSDSVPWAGAFDASGLPRSSSYQWIAAYRLAP